MFSFTPLKAFSEIMSSIGPTSTPPRDLWKRKYEALEAQVATNKDLGPTAKRFPSSTPPKMYLLTYITSQCRRKSSVTWSCCTSPCGYVPHTKGVGRRE